MNIIGIVVFSIILVVLLYYYFWYSNNKKNNKNMLSKFMKFSNANVSTFSLAVISAYFLNDLVTKLNQFIIFPIIKSSFPSQDIWLKGYEIGRGNVVYPWLFIQGLFSFFISLMILFLIIQMLYFVNVIVLKKILFYGGFIFTFSIIIWNFIVME